MAKTETMKDNKGKNRNFGSGQTLVNVLVAVLAIIVPVAVGFAAIVLPITFNQLSKRLDNVGDLVKAVRADMGNNYNRLQDSISGNKDAITDLTSYVDKQIHNKELRIIRIEDFVKLKRPLSTSSPVAITDFGKEMLHESGMNTLLAKYKPELTKIFHAKNLPTSPTALDVEEVARDVIDNYPSFKEEDTRSIDKYMFSHIEGRIFDIWEIAAIRFRNMILEDLGMPVPKCKDEKPSTE